MVDLESVEGDFAADDAWFQQRLKTLSGTITGTVAEIEKWASFSEETDFDD